MDIQKQNNVHLKFDLLSLNPFSVLIVRTCLAAEAVAIAAQAAAVPVQVVPAIAAHGRV